MASMRVGMQVRIDTPVRAFGFQRVPPYLHQEQIALLAPYKQDGVTQSKSTVQLAGFRVVPEGGVMLYEPQPQKVATTLAAYNFPTGGSSDWHEASDSVTGVGALVMSNANWNNVFDVKMNASLPTNSAFYARIGRGQVVTPPSGSTFDSSNFYTVMTVGEGTSPDGSGATPFRLVLQDGKPPFLQQGVVDPSDATQWYWAPFGSNGVVGVEISDCSELFSQQNRVIPIQWIPLPKQNTLIVDIANGRERLVFRPSNTSVVNGNGDQVLRQYTQNLQVIAGPVRLGGQNGSAHWQYLPMQFAPKGQMYSGEIDIPFVYQGNGFIDLADSEIPEGYTVTWGIYATDFTGTRLKYFIQIDSGSADPVSVSPLITQIQMRIPPIFDYTATVGVVYDVSSKISEITEHQYFDAEAGIVRTQIGVMFDNTHGDFSGFAGTHRAVQYSRWLEYQAGDGTMQPLTAPIPMLTGWTGHKGSVVKSDPTRTFDAVFDDNFYPLERCKALITTVLDGYCCLAAERLAMNMQGRSDDFIADAFKTCDFGPNPVGCPHLKLPLGVGTSPRFAPSPEGSYLDLLREINSFLFAVIWSDSQGVAQIMPYYPGIYQTPFKGVFGVEESGNPANSDFLTSMWHRQMLTIDTTDRRTGVAFYGLDPATNMVQGTFLNIDDFYPGWIANNHGFRDNLVSVSNLFVDPAFTAYYAQAALSRLVLPNIWEQHDCCFLPNLYCLDRYAVEEDNEMISGIVPLIVEQITSRFHVIDSRILGSTVMGRWAANLQ